MTGGVENQYARVQNLTRLVQRLIGRNQQLRLALKIKVRFGFLKQNTPARRDLNLALVVLYLARKREIQNCEAVSTGAGRLLENDIVTIVTIKRDSGAD